MRDSTVGMVTTSAVTNRNNNHVYSLIRVDIGIKLKVSLREDGEVYIVLFLA